MSKELRRVRLDEYTDLVRILEAVHDDKVPRLIERGGESLAVVVSPEGHAEAASVPKSRRFKQDLLALAGVWSDLDADALTKQVYRARHASPPSPPISE